MFTSPTGLMMDQITLIRYLDSMAKWQEAHGEDSTLVRSTITMLAALWMTGARQ